MRTAIQKAALEGKVKFLRKEIERAQVFLTLLDYINKSGKDLRDIAHEAGVAESTLYFWLSGYTRFPRLDTVVKVATALGLTVTLQKTRANKKQATR